jgi:predicted alpha-1,6-mannanase (GH76 family)
VWDLRQTVDGLPLFAAFWDREAELPKVGGKDAQFVAGAVNASEIPERDLSVQLSGWMLMEAAHTLSDDSLGNHDEQPREPIQEEEAE